jgi:diacylglycerol kinase family enzyme
MTGRPASRPPSAFRDVLLVLNADAGDAAPEAEAVVAILEREGFRARSIPADDDWTRALRQRPDLVAVLGGDGTVSAVVTTMVGRDIPIAILPAGTANNIARTLGVGGDAESLVGGWRRATVMPLDVWEVRDGRRTQRFVEAIGGGFMGHHIRRGEEAESPSLILGGALDRGRYLLASAVSEAPEAEWQIEVDGRDHSGRYIGVEAMSIRSIGPHATFAPQADPGDGRLDLVLIRADQRDALLEGLAAEVTDEPSAWPTFPTVGARTICMAPEDRVPLHVDDVSWQSSEHATREIRVGLAGQVGLLHGA